MQKSKFGIRILSEDVFFAGKVEHALSRNPVWECIVKTGVEKEIDKYDDTVNVLILVYDFQHQTPETVLEKLKRNYPKAKFLGIVPEDCFVILRDFLLDKEVIDVIRMCSLIYDMIYNHVRNIYDKWTLQQKLLKLERLSNSSETFVSKAQSMEHVQELIHKAADSDINVSIYGETGTGKEVVARKIHSLSSRKHAAFVAVNVAAIPGELIESSFFGHEKGAFTGAIARKTGFFEEASGGTLFLDEIGDMDIKMQAKLLRALQEGVITRVGGTGEVKIDVRIITATHVDMQKLIEQERFREDLFYRLMGLSINLPKLSERGDDILLLANHFIKGYCSKSKKAICTLSKEAKEVLLRYSFPGNIRELKAMMELAVVLSENNVIRPEDLTLRHEVARDEKDFLEVERTLEKYETMIIKHFLQKYDNKVRLVAEKLDIGKTKIYKLIQENKLNKS